MKDSENRQVDNVLELLEELEEGPRKYLEKFLVNAPFWLLGAFYLRHMEKDTTIVQENEAVSKVYILVDGYVKGIDYQDKGETFEHTWFHPIYIFGSMEVLLNLPVYRTTLVTVTDCSFLEISRSVFEKWMHSDINALLMEVDTIGNSLLRQLKQSRGMLFIDGRERLLVFLAQHYEKCFGETSCRIPITRQQMADSTGLSVRTVNRLARELEEEHLIERKGAKIWISDEQFRRICEQLPEQWSEFFEPDISIAE